MRILILSLALATAAWGGEEKTVYFPGREPVTHEQLLACLRAHRLSLPAARLEKQLAPAVRLIAVTNAPVAHPVASKFGGLPALADGAAWPAWRGSNLAFLAQINLAELQAAAPRAELPAKGLLLFFHDVEQRTEKGSWAVLHVAEPPTKTVAWPTGLPAEGHVKELPMKFRPVQTLPADPHAVARYDGLTEGQKQRFDEIVYEFAERSRPLHQLFGHAAPIQGDEQEKDEVLLAMIDSNDAGDLMWGDAGRLYFWIRQDDLRARRFENVRLVDQCY